GRAPGVVPEGRAAGAPRDALSPGGRAGGPRRALVPQARRRRDAAPDLRRLAGRRHARDPGPARPRRRDPLRLPGGRPGGAAALTMRLVDLSFPITPHFRWKAESERPPTPAAGDPLQSTILTLSCHAYTHVDAPLHFLPNRRSVAGQA